MNKVTAPKVTVLMPVFNGEKYLGEAIESILNQTFSDFELLIINDGSTDTSVEIINSYNDPRIRLVQNEENLGLIATLNKGMDLACGEYIARMDCDDVSLPKRLDKQVTYMDKHPNVGVCGTWFRWIDGPLHNKTVCWQTDYETIKCGLMFVAMIGHPTALMRTKIFRQHKLYYDFSYIHAEDFELWSRAWRYCELSNIGETLYLYRAHSDQVSQRCSPEQIRSADKIRMNQLKLLGITPTKEEFEIHKIVSDYHSQKTDNLLERVDKWFCKLIAANRKKEIYSEKALIKIFAELWLVVCIKSIVRRSAPWQSLSFPEFLMDTGWEKKDIFRQLIERLNREHSGGNINVKNFLRIRSRKHREF